MNEQRYTAEQFRRAITDAFKDGALGILADEMAQMAIDQLTPPTTPPPEYRDGDVAWVVDGGDRCLAQWKNGKWVGGLFHRDELMNVTHVEMIRPAGSVCVTPDPIVEALRCYVKHLEDANLRAYAEDVKGIIRKLTPESDK